MKALRREPLLTALRPSLAEIQALAADVITRSGHCVGIIDFPKVLAFISLGARDSRGSNQTGRWRAALASTSIPATPIPRSEPIL